MIGIYIITNNTTNESYIGQSNNVERRFFEHRSPSNIKGSRSLVAQSIRKYGIENFSFEILKECTQEELIDLERMFIKKLHPALNRQYTGWGHTEATKCAIRKKTKEHWNNLTDDEKNRIIKCNLVGPGKNHQVSQSARMKISETLKGRPLSKAHKQKISDSLKGKPKDNSSRQKAVQMIDIKTGEVLKTFESIKNASSYVGVTASSINKALKGVQKTSGEMCWRYV